MFKSFMDIFSDNIKKHTTKPAIIFNKKIITYSELNEKSNHLAGYLLELGLRQEEIVPLILERGPNMIVAIIAIFKAGGAFLPISPITPCSRIKYIVEDCGASLIFCSNTLENILGSKIKIVDPAHVPQYPSIKFNKINRNQLSYVMYTSGSTGNPKGVLIEHHSMMNLYYSLIDEFNITSQDQVLALTDFTFDISLIELLMPLLTGATIILTEQGTVANGVKIMEYLRNYTVTFMQATPLTWEILLKQGWKNDGNIKILVGGEKFNTKLAIRLDYKKKNIWNMYGPTETSMWSMCNRLVHEIESDTVPLGTPICNTIIEILDEDLNLVRAGDQGELFIGGEGLARGYLNNENLTKEKFIFHPKTNIRLYKTGDLVISDKNNNICYQGRIDDQLKFGGIRIESGEIENVIQQEPFIKKAVVKVHETDEYYKSLAAYIEIDEERIVLDDIHPSETEVTYFLKNIYDEAYSHADQFEHGTMNNCGWQSSFTGTLIPVEELNESCYFIKKVIEASDLSDVLEVGCGTGSLLFDYIERAEKCSIVELSSKAIEYVREKIQTSKFQLKEIEFRNESVTNVHDHNRFSCIIVNSVIQYLPTVLILVNTIKQLVQSAKSGGNILIGDVRCLELFDLYILEKIRMNSENQDALNSNLRTFFYKSRDSEIILSPKFFYALQRIIPEISYVDISVKHGNYKNELNYFRYDVVLYVNKEIEYKEPVLIQYSPTIQSQFLYNQIQLNKDVPLVVHSVPNTYVKSILSEYDEMLLTYLGSNLEKNYQINEEIVKEINSLISLNIEGYQKYIQYDETNPLQLLTIHYYPKHNTKIMRIKKKEEYSNYKIYSREPFNPWLQKFYQDHIRLKVKQNLISWVNPSVYIWVEKWPLSINGKLDKKKLQLPSSPHVSQDSNSTLAKLQILWRNITGDEAIIYKEFWVHGISSLCMYFFLATINETFYLNINYHDFHEYNTIEKLTEYIDSLLQDNK